MFSKPVTYFINKNIVSIAIATFITNIIWFIIGEIDFSTYHLKIKDYLFLGINILIYIICGIKFNSILGCILYCVLLGISLLIFERKEIKEVIIKCYGYLKNYIKSNRKVIN